MNDLEDVALTNRIKSGRRHLVAGELFMIAGVISALLAAAMLLAS